MSKVVIKCLYIILKGQTGVIKAYSTHKSTVTSALAAGRREGKTEGDK